MKEEKNEGHNFSDAFFIILKRENKIFFIEIFFPLIKFLKKLLVPIGKKPTPRHHEFDNKNNLLRPTNLIPLSILV